MRAEEDGKMGKSQGLILAWDQLVPDLCFGFSFISLVGAALLLTYILTPAAAAPPQMWLLASLSFVLSLDIEPPAYSRWIPAGQLPQRTSLSGLWAT